MFYLISISPRPCRILGMVRMKLLRLAAQRLTEAQHRFQLIRLLLHQILVEAGVEPQAYN